MAELPGETTAGMMMIVVGPSGAGKDSLMAIAAGHFAGHEKLHFARRAITRPHDAGGEAHEALSQATFAERQAAGQFAVSWQAHGLSYGIPMEMRDRVVGGQLVIANGSRSALADIQKAFGRLRVVNITARPEVLAARLEARGRESRDDILRRLDRSSLTVDGDFDVVTIDNSEALDEAGQALIAMLDQALSELR
jgi:ribose 1,5-bisphosphokinase